MFEAEDPGTDGTTAVAKTLFIAVKALIGVFCTNLLEVVSATTGLV